MSRTDAKQLNVPTVPSEPNENESKNLKNAEKPKSPVESLLESMDKTSTLIQRSDRCGSCKSVLSGIEIKMGRCQTCGKTIEDTSGDQGPSSNPTQKFEVRI